MGNEKANEDNNPNMKFVSSVDKSICIYSTLSFIYALICFTYLIFFTHSLLSSILRLLFICSLVLIPILIYLFYKTNSIFKLCNQTGMLKVINLVHIILFYVNIIIIFYISMFVFCFHNTIFNQDFLGYSVNVTMGLFAITLFNRFIDKNIKDDLIFFNKSSDNNFLNNFWITKIFILVILVIILFSYIFLFNDNSTVEIFFAIITSIINPEFVVRFTFLNTNKVRHFCVKESIQRYFAFTKLYLLIYEFSLIITNIIIKMYYEYHNTKISQYSFKNIFWEIVISFMLYGFAIVILTFSINSKKWKNFVEKWTVDNDVVMTKTITKLKNNDKTH